MITLTVGENTLGTFVEADAYFEESLSEDRWCPIDTDRKKQALIQAFRVMSQMSWDGEKTDPLQTSPFPRTGLFDIEGNEFDSLTIPDIALFGQFELALYLADNGGFENPTKGAVKKVKAGSASVEFFELFSDGDLADSRIAKFPQEILQYFDVLSGSGNADSGIAIGFVSGDDVHSFFDGTEYGVN